MTTLTIIVKYERLGLLFLDLGLSYESSKRIVELKGKFGNGNGAVNLPFGANVQNDVAPVNDLGSELLVLI